MYLTRAGSALLLALIFSSGMVAGSPDDEDFKRDPQAADDRGFPWLCFVTSIAAIAGLYVVVHRRQQAIESEIKKGHGPPIAWYCRACDRDVLGPEGSRWHAPNPYEHDDVARVKTRRRREPGRGAESRSRD